ncbi:MAG: NADH-quinone oxidoreductase subunit F [Piscirickettsiaceae bacterium]|nr:MAG: NADH-quinone oxidoreductase subunit F [Piscirickettsiaceae bacterium]PCI68120.1 MAG: NADH-quinone oxidoreductase subunit F [Piscirickettsiaceae bacterium]
MSNDQLINVRPGNKKKRKGRVFQRGRQLDPSAQADIKALLGSRPRRKDLLIEHLHLIQDKWSHISAAHLRALADELRLSQAEVYEVATFYHHFDVVKENETPPAKLTIRICNSLSCEMAGAHDLLKELKADASADIRIQTAPCMGLCNQSPAAAVGRQYVGYAKSTSLLHDAQHLQNTPKLPHYQTYNDYIAQGGYTLLKSFYNNSITAEHVLNTLSESGLKGLGGAGFPTVNKLRIVREQPAPKYFCVNADEGEPGTFKDRHYLSNEPHQILEGMLIAAHLIDASKIYIYLRDEYASIYELLQIEIQQLIEHQLIDANFIDIRRGAGAYICGEESAMIESIEGKRGIPRHRPPYVSEQGLFNRPTLVQNIETLYWIPAILTKGAQWFKLQGKNGAYGPRSFSLSGRVKKPGVIVAPAGSCVDELIALAGGMPEGHTLKAYLPGGASGGILPASLSHLPLDFGSLDEYGCFVGSHAVIVLSDQDSIKQSVRNLLNFFNNESCGQCTPCRIGCDKAHTLLSEEHWDKPLLKELSAVMADASICGLGQAAPNPILSAIKFFENEV